MPYYFKPKPVFAVYLSCKENKNTREATDMIFFVFFRGDIDTILISNERDR